MADSFEVETSTAIEKSAGPGFGSIAGVVAGAASFSTLSDMIPSTVAAYALRDALKQAAVLICCDVLAQDIAKAPLEIVDRETGKVLKPSEHPLAEMFALDPNQRHTWFEWKEMVVFWYALTTTAFIYVSRNRMGDPLALIPLQTGRVLPQIVDNKTFYRASALTLQERELLGVTSLDAPEMDMIHIRGRMMDGLNGYPTLYAGASTLDVGAALETYIEDLFKEGGSIRGVFERAAEGALDEAAFIRLKEQLRVRLNKFRKGEPLILEDGLKFNPIAASPTDTDYTKQFDAQIVQTCRLFRMPPHKAMHLNAIKYENLEPMEKSYVNDTVLPVCQRMEEKFDRHLLSRADRLKFQIRFNREALVFTDEKTRSEWVTRAAERGLISRNEGRRKLHQNPIPGGDTFLIPAQMQLVDENNEIVVAAGQPPGAGGEQQDPQQDQEKPKPPKKGLKLVSNQE